MTKYFVNGTVLYDLSFAEAAGIQCYFLAGVLWFAPSRTLILIELDQCGQR